MPGEKQEIHERRHPLYNKYKDEWKFFLQAALGGKDYYENELNLFTHRLEDQAGDYDDRLERVYYLNYCNLVCSIYADYIFKEVIRRPNNDILDSFRKNVDGRGTDIDSFMTKLSFLSSVYGHVHVLVDSPDISDKGRIPLHQYKSNVERFNPYTIIIPPTDLVDWALDEFGNPFWVLIRFRGYDDIDPHKKREKNDQFMLLTRDKWEMYNDKGERQKNGTNELGEVYLVTCYNKDANLDMVGESLITDISRINRIIYNWCSNIDEMIERQTFSQLIVPEDPETELGEKGEKDDPLKVVSTSQAFTFPAGAGHPPAFISPDTAQIDIIWKMIQQHIEKIYELAGLGTVGSQSKFLSQRSGISQGYQFLSVNSSLAKKASRLERAENAINRLVLRWLDALNAEDEYKELVEYPKQFDILGLTDTMLTTFDIVSRNFSETLNIELLKALAKKAAPVLSDEDLNTIYNEIEKGKGKIENPQLQLGAAAQQAQGRMTGQNNNSDDTE